MKRSESRAEHRTAPEEQAELARDRLHSRRLAQRQPISIQYPAHLNPRPFQLHRTFHLAPEPVCRPHVLSVDPPYVAAMKQALAPQHSPHSRPPYASHVCLEQQPGPSLKQQAIVARGVTVQSELHAPHFSTCLLEEREVAPNLWPISYLL
eukprot:762714-Hanusia_phi.AAC.2